MKKYDTAKSKYDKELIDTLWNVNTHYALTLLRLLGINRYIMECKYTRDFTISHFRESN